MRHGRKRSAAITLVLAGTLSGCGEPTPQRDVYQNLTSCQRDWQADGHCEPVRDNRYSNTWYYGPNHYGTNYSSGRPRPSPNAIDALHSPRGTAVMAHSGGSASSRTSSVSRGGFGSTSSSMSSGS
jgi:hypothetical protein